MFNADLDQCLAFITEHKAQALKQRKSIDWEGMHVDILTYMDNVSQDTWRETFIPLLEGVMTDTAEQLALSFGSRFDVQNIGSLQWFDEYTMTFATDIVDTTKTGLSDLLQQAQYEGWTISQMQDRMELMFQQWRDGSTDSEEWDWYDERMPNYRREMIARTETMRASNYGSANIMAEAGVERKEWLATNDNRTRETHLTAWDTYSGDGAILMNDAFDVGGESLMYPGDPDGDPSETINCRCTLIPHLDSSLENNPTTDDEEQ